MQLKDVAGLLFELWTLMDTTREEKSKLSRITSVLRLSEAEVTEPGALSLEVIEQVCEHAQSFQIYCLFVFFPLLVFISFDQLIQQ